MAPRVPRESGVVDRHGPRYLRRHAPPSGARQLGRRPTAAAADRDDHPVLGRDRRTGSRVARRRAIAHGDPQQADRDGRPRRRRGRGLARCPRRVLVPAADAVANTLMAGGADTRLEDRNVHPRSLPRGARHDAGVAARARAACLRRFRPGARPGSAAGGERVEHRAGQSNRALDREGRGARRARASRTAAARSSAMD